LITSAAEGRQMDPAGPVAAFIGIGSGLCFDPTSPRRS
jgi:hypothetical protein